MSRANLKKSLGAIQKHIERALDETGEMQLILDLPESRKSSSFKVLIKGRDALSIMLMQFLDLVDDLDRAI